jgi:GntR family transcriptional regulator, arabinose operon transcriptional repressor
MIVIFYIKEYQMIANGAQKAQPKYRQVKETLLRLLSTEQYTANQKLPTEESLIRQFQVSRGTVRQAMAELESEGVLYKVQGSGTFFSGKMPGNRKSSSLLGVITPLITTYIFPQIIQGITDVAQQKCYSIVLGASQTSPGNELGCLEQLISKGIDGLLLDPAFNFQYTPDARLFEFLKTLTIPVVFMGVMIEDAEFSSVSLDDVVGGVKATQYLLDAGHRRIACIYPANLLSGLHRSQGYRKALAAQGITYDCRLDKALKAEMEAAPFKHTQMALLIQELLDLGKERPTAIVFYNDGMAVRGYQYLEAAGLHVPADISLISFDDSELALQPKVQLTSIIHPKYYLGKWAAELVLDQIATPGRHFPRHLRISPTLAIRNSVRTI